jgi:dihydropteroate synthase
MGRLAPAVEGAAQELECGFVVAGRRDLLFAAAEIISREDERVKRRRISAREIGDAIAHDPKLSSLITRVCMPRAPLAGLALDRPRIMGIVNVTPDSFSDGGRYLTPAAAIEHALRLEAEGADILDIGGESTRPGAEPVSLDMELGRILPVLEGLAGRTRALLSIDTRKAEVMRRAAAAGVHLINDISALAYDERSLTVAAETGLPVLLMHARGDPQSMQKDPRYADVLLDVYDELARRIEACERSGIRREKLIVDPGIGFGKTLEHNLSLLSGLSLFHGLGCAIALGVSRKSFIGRLTGAAAEDRLPGSIAGALLGIAQGVQIVRVHDVAATRQALMVWEAANDRRSAESREP